MNADKDKLDSLTERVLGAVFEVTNTLGSGFLEKVYQRALLRELTLRGIRATAEASFTVTYKSHSVGVTVNARERPPFAPKEWEFCGGETPGMAVKTI